MVSCAPGVVHVVQHNERHIVGKPVNGARVRVSWVQTAVWSQEKSQHLLGQTAC